MVVKGKNLVGQEENCPPQHQHMLSMLGKISKPNEGVRMFIVKGFKANFKNM